jgi:acetyl esterase/lipase
MLKARDAAYGTGRRKGGWWKWKVAPFTADAVLIYAQRGHGRRASLYTDYTFGVWNEGELVPFAKAYSGLTDAEIRRVDAFVRRNTVERFGPVRVVRPELVFELAFEGIQRSSRHRSGVAVRFPRMARWRTDKRPEDATGCRPSTGPTEPSGIEVRADVAYGPLPAQRLDLYLPAGPRDPRPAVLLIHGGGWSDGQRGDMKDIAVALAGQGFVAASAGYRLVDGERNRFPVQLDDVQRAVRWLRANAATLGIDPPRICALGFSAGGHLAALLGTRDVREAVDPTLAAHSSRVGCVVNAFGPTDLTVPFPVEHGIEQRVIALIGAPRERAPDLFRDASPIHHLDGRSAAFLHFHGLLDPLVPVEQTRRMHAALLAAGASSTYIEFPDEGHAIAQPRNVSTFVRAMLDFVAAQPPLSP